MIESLISISIVGVILIISEILLSRKILHGEVSRKFVHIVAGTFIASWAFYMDAREIQILSIVLLVGVIVSKFFKLFGSVHSVDRRTWGEAFFAIAIGLTVTLAPNQWVFAAAILHMSLADGFAAVLGTKFGKSTSYTVFGQYKTLVGTVTFYFISSAIIAWLILLSGAGISEQAWLAIIWLPLVATITENIATSGLDNVAVPLVVIGALHIMGQIYV